MTFNPKQQLVEIKFDGKQRPMLQGHDAISWFWQEHPAPSGSIITILDLPNSIVRAEIRVDGVLVATGHKKGDDKTSLEKLETRAIRRALANAGYGTAQALAFEDDPDQDDISQQARVAVTTSQIDHEAVRQSLAGSNGHNRVGDPPVIKKRPPIADPRSGMDRELQQTIADGVGEKPQGPWSNQGRGIEDEAEPPADPVPLFDEE